MDTLLAMIVSAGVCTLVDIRSNPLSSHYPQFHTDHLRPSLESCHIAYHRAGRQLGGYRQPHPGSRHTAIESDTLRAYADYMESEQFVTGIAQMMRIARQSKTAVLCTDRRPQGCHRSLISDSWSCGACSCIT